MFLGFLCFDLNQLYLINFAVYKLTNKLVKNIILSILYLNLSLLYTFSYFIRIIFLK